MRGKRILLTGACGMLSADLIPLCLDLGIDLVLSDRKGCEIDGRTIGKFDISNPQEVNRIVSSSKPEWIINCAAYTAVDAAEAEPERAFAANSIGPKNLAIAARESGAKLLHLSTDYVFGCDKSQRRTPYSESDPVAPCGIYGKSKSEGEQWIINILEGRGLIVRTSWLHGKHGRNFVDTMLKLGAEQKSVAVVTDQIGSPTWTGWLVEIMLELVARDARGVVHCSSRGDISWFDIAKEIFMQANLNVEVKPQSTDELGRPAPRPAYATLNVSKLEALLGRPCISWQESIAAHLKSLH